MPTYKYTNRRLLDEEDLSSINENIDKKQDKLADNSISTSMLQDNSVTSNKLDTALNNIISNAIQKPESLTAQEIPVVNTDKTITYVSLGDNLIISNNKLNAKSIELPGFINYFSNNAISSSSYGNNKYKFESTYSMQDEEGGKTLKEGIFDFTIAIQGDTNIILGLATDGTTLQIKLSDTLVNKINNSLKLESNIPEEFKLVGINVKNYQENINLGDNLSYDAVTKKLNASGGGVPVLEELPTEVADNTPKVFYYKNELYIVQEPPTGETWVLNEEPSSLKIWYYFDSSYAAASVDDFSFIVNFTSNGKKFVKMSGDTVGPDPIYDTSKCVEVRTKSDGWVNESYRTITFEEAVTDSNLLTWLQANGVKQ
nr:MAG TPA: hypothetical protein [Caudoviricetes sp.]